MPSWSTTRPRSPSPDDITQEYKRALQPVADDRVNVLTEEQFALHSKAHCSREMGRYHAIGDRLVDGEKISEEELAAKRSVMKEQLQNACTVMQSHHRSTLRQPEQAPATGIRAPQDGRATIRQIPPRTDSPQRRPMFKTLPPIEAMTNARVTSFTASLKDIEARMERSQLTRNDANDEAWDRAVAEFNSIPAASSTQV